MFMVKSSLLARLQSSHYREANPGACWQFAPQFLLPTQCGDCESCLLWHMNFQALDSFHIKEGLSRISPCSKEKPVEMGRQSSVHRAAFPEQEIAVLKMKLSWQSSCLACRRPWVQSHLHMVVHACGPHCHNAKTGGSEL